MRRHFLRLFACALLALTAIPETARAGQSLPYRGQFDFAVVSVEPVSQTEVLVTATLAGEETHLGAFEGVVQYYVDLTTGMFVGSLYKQAANGDELYETLTGQFTATGAMGDFSMTGGTGRFLSATGGGTYVSAWTDAAMTTGHVTFSGSIGYDASDRRN
jgi:hypothetical protein